MVGLEEPPHSRGSSPLSSVPSQPSPQPSPNPAADGSNATVTAIDRPRRNRIPRTFSDAGSDDENAAMRDAGDVSHDEEYTEPSGRRNSRKISTPTVNSPVAETKPPIQTKTGFTSIQDMYRNKQTSNLNSSQNASQPASQSQTASSQTRQGLGAGLSQAANNNDDAESYDTPKPYNPNKKRKRARDNPVETLQAKLSMSQSQWNDMIKWTRTYFTNLCLAGRTGIDATSQPVRTDTYDTRKERFRQVVEMRFGAMGDVWADIWHYLYHLHSKWQRANPQETIEIERRPDMVEEFMQKEKEKQQAISSGVSMADFRKSQTKRNSYTAPSPSTRTPTAAATRHAANIGTVTAETRSPYAQRSRTSVAAARPADMDDTEAKADTLLAIAGAAGGDFDSDYHDEPEPVQGAEEYTGMVTRGRAPSTAARGGQAFGRPQAQDYASIPSKRQRISSPNSAQVTTPQPLTHRSSTSHSHSGHHHHHHRHTHATPTSTMAQAAHMATAAPYTATANGVHAHADGAEPAAPIREQTYTGVPVLLDIRMEKIAFLNKPNFSTLSRVAAALLPDDPNSDWSVDLLATSVNPPIFIDSDEALANAYAVANAGNPSSEVKTEVLSINGATGGTSAGSHASTPSTLKVVGLPPRSKPKASVAGGSNGIA